MKALDWLARAAMLTFAGLATLSMIAAIAAIPGGGLGIGRPAELRSDAPGRQGGLAAARDSASRAPDSAEGLSAGVVVDGPMSSPPPAEAAWRETLAYTLLAIAGFCAAILIILLRISAQISSLIARDRL